jgi:hypothetical protein
VPLECYQSTKGLKVEEEDEEDFGSDLLEHITIDDQNTCFEYHLSKKASPNYGSWVDGEAQTDQMW